MHDWVEIALDYRCNLRCLGCRACEDTGEELAPATVARILRESRARSIPNLWIGGGEPTLRSDLGSIVATARSLGFERVLVQTNGMRLAYAPFATALVRAGVTDVSLNVKSWRAEVHDRLSRVEGSHALLQAGLANLRGTGVRIAADVLLTRATADDLPSTVAEFAERGVTKFTLWLLSAADSDDPEVAREVPPLGELSARVAEASEVAREHGAELFSLHTPPCTLPMSARDRYLPAKALRLVVIDPSGRSFPLESSPFEGGHYAEACGRCASRPTCGGVRSDYVALHGSTGLAPI